MPEYMQGYLFRKELGLGVALYLNQINNEKIKKQWSEFAVESGMSVLAAKDALRAYEKLERAKRESPEDTEVPEVPATPPVAYVRCVRCGGTRPMQQTKFVRICNPVCQSEETPPEAS